MRDASPPVVIGVPTVRRDDIMGGEKKTHLADGKQREFQRELKHLEPHTRANQPLWVVLLIRDAVKLT